MILLLNDFSFQMFIVWQNTNDSVILEHDLKTIRNNKNEKYRINNQKVLI